MTEKSSPNDRHRDSFSWTHSQSSMSLHRIRISTGSTHGIISIHTFDRSDRSRAFLDSSPSPRSDPHMDPLSEVTRWIMGIDRHDEYGHPLRHRLDAVLMRSQMSRYDSESLTRYSGDRSATSREKEQARYFQENSHPRSAPVLITPPYGANGLRTNVLRYRPHLLDPCPLDSCERCRILRTARIL